MLGAIIGDVVGSVYEYGSDKTKEFPLFVPGCSQTDDTILTVCVGCTCAETSCRNESEFKRTLIKNMKHIGGKLYPNESYGEKTHAWLISDSTEPYGANTNGSAMRVSPCGWALDTLEETEILAKWSAEITHDHPEGIKGAQAVAAAIFMARTGSSKEEIQAYVEDKYYDLSFTLDEIRPHYSHDMTCEGSVPQAIVCFLEAEDFEDAIRNAVSLGGDGDTLAAIAGSIAEAYFGIPDELAEEVFDYVDEPLAELYRDYSYELY